MDTTLVPRIRRPAVAGYYYPDDPELLRQMVARLVAQAHPACAPAASLCEAERAGAGRQARSAYAVIVPHGSFRHSGAIAGAAFGQIHVPARCVILGPSHTGSWMRWSLMASGAYQTPLGAVEIDESFCAALLARCPFLEADAWGQRGEHAIEVVLPFLQFLRPQGLAIAPMVTSSEDLEELTALAQALGDVILAQAEDVLLIASSDLSHYERADSGLQKDRRLLEAILKLDASQLRQQVQERTLLMCGYGPVACVLLAARRLGATRAELVRYGTSLEAGGDPHSVTGYAGIVVR